MDEQNKAIVVTLYTVIGEFSRVAESIIKQYEPVTQEIVEHTNDGAGQEHLVIRLQDGSQLNALIHCDDQYVKAQIPGMHNFFAQAPCPNDKLHQSVLNQISVFNCIVNINFEEDDEQNRTNYLINTAFDVAAELFAIVLFASMQLYTAEKKLLLAHDGRTDYNEYIPVGNSDFLDNGADESPADETRKQRSFAKLDEKGIPYLPQLRAAVMESEAQIRTPEEIAHRLFAMFATCLYSEVRLDSSREEGLTYVERVNKMTKGLLGGGILDKEFTPEEKAFLAEAQPAQHTLAKFGWRYECCYVLLWALGYVDELKFPDSICDVPFVSRTIRESDSLKNFLKHIRPRSKDELLDAADLILRYHWAATDARVNQKQGAPANLDEEVLFEWHYTLNWLIGANARADWDDIQPHT